MKDFEIIRSLLRDSRIPMRVVTLVTLYRIVTFPVLMVLLFADYREVFKWMLLVSFLTDALDGYLARKHHVVSKMGAKLDSVGDNLTVVAAMAGLMLLRWDFIREQWVVFLLLLVPFVVQVLYALIKFGKTSSFHTYLAKAAAVLQGVFLTSFFFLDRVIYPLFYLAAVVTICELIEEIIITAVMKQASRKCEGAVLGAECQKG